MLFIGLGLFLGAGLFLETNHHYMLETHRIIFYGIPSFLIVTSMVLFEKNVKISDKNILVTIGNASYVLYLIHSIILCFFDKTIILNKGIYFLTPQITSLFVMVIIVVLSCLLQIYIEKNVISYGNNFRYAFSHKLKQLKIAGGGT